jgi:hypothetical protein
MIPVCQTCMNLQGVVRIRYEEKKQKKNFYPLVKFSESSLSLRNQNADAEDEKTEEIAST